MNQSNGNRVRTHTTTEVNRKIDQLTDENVLKYADQDESTISRRIDELDKEWDTERVLETNASILDFSGLMLGTFVNRRWFALPVIVSSFLFQHATQGWCPPLPLIRRLGVRTRQEIDAEKYALKAIRGDFDPIVQQTDKQARARQALSVV